MTRVHVICEGQTKETFINEVLSHHFSSMNIFLFPSLIGKPGHKGGNFKIERLLTDLRNRLLGDTAAYCTTFFDFYGLPSNFPGKKEALNKLTCREKSKSFLQALMNALRSKLDEDALRRFIPYVQMHEFEGLLFSHPAALATGIGRPDLHDSFQEIRDQFPTPEDINDSPMTAPSKRIEALFPQYDKPLHGSLTLGDIGLSTIREECVLFDRWLNRIEELTSQS